MSFANASGAGTASDLYSNSAGPAAAAGGACTAISFRTGALSVHCCYLAKLQWSQISPLTLEAEDKDEF